MAKYDLKEKIDAYLNSKLEPEIGDLQKRYAGIKTSYKRAQEDFEYQLKKARALRANAKDEPKMKTKFFGRQGAKK